MPVIHRPTAARLQTICRALRQLARLDPLAASAIDRATFRMLQQARRRARHAQK